ncbi:MAG: sensor histidine kinase [Alphaproteobacteria bacterium]
MSKFKIPINEPFRLRIWQVPVIIMLSLIGFFTIRTINNWDTLKNFTEDRKPQDTLLVQGAVKILAQEKGDNSEAIVRRFEAILQGIHRYTVVLIGRYPGSPESIVQAVNPLSKEVVEQGIQIWQSQNEEIYKGGLNFSVKGHEYHIVARKSTINKTVWETVLISNISTTIWEKFAQNLAWLGILSFILSGIVILGFICVARPIIHLKTAIRKEEKFYPVWYCPVGIKQVGEAYNQYLEVAKLAKVQIAQSTTGQMIVLAPKDGAQATIYKPNLAMLRISGHDDLDGEFLNLIVPEEYHDHHFGIGRWSSKKERYIGLVAYASGCPFHGKQKSDIVDSDRPVPLLRKDGSIAQVILGVYYLGEDNGYYRYAGAITDVTEIVEAKEFERLAREELEQLQRAWRHDLLSSVKNVKDQMRLLQKMGVTFEDDTQANSFAIACRKADLAYELVNNTRNLNNWEENLHLEKVSVSCVFEQLKTMYSVNNIVYKQPEQEYWIEVDVNQFVGRAIANIINNAIKYSGGINENIEIGFREKEDNGVFYVKDQGMGMSPEGVEKIMGDGFGIGVRLAPEYEGTGLGLYSAKRIFKAHNAKMSVQSILGQGSVFFVKLPLAKS